MPVFHTKTIEGILLPVAQQVSKLVILHQEAEDGNAMPDLTTPVNGVSDAVNNLVIIGKETTISTTDEVLKKDMPIALNRVQDASQFLKEAAYMLKADPFSQPARAKLIEGSRGILQGTSALLLALDKSEVRRILRRCKNVQAYLAITEVVETMDDLLGFVQNLTPLLTSLTKEVDTRQQELTHQVHRDMLLHSLDEVKSLTPIVISSIKTCVNTFESGGVGLQEAQENRSYVVNKMMLEIGEIERVLQLTTYDEDEWDSDDITIMKRATTRLETNTVSANEWLANPALDEANIGALALRQIIDDANKVAERCVDPVMRDTMLRNIANIETMTKQLCELRKRGQGNTPAARELAQNLGMALERLNADCVGIVDKAEKLGVTRPAHTIAGKIDQAQRWISSPQVDDKGVDSAERIAQQYQLMQTVDACSADLLSLAGMKLGEQAARMVVTEGRKVADTLPEPMRTNLTKLCDNVEALTGKLADFCRRGQGNSPEARQVAQALSQKLHALKDLIQDGLVGQVVEEFADIEMPIRRLQKAAFAPLGTPNREFEFEDNAIKFINHSKNLATIGRMVAAAGCNNKKLWETIMTHTQQATDLTPQVVHAAKICLARPESQAVREHFELLKKVWISNMEHLRSLVDEAIDTASFIKASEEGIIRHSEKCEHAISDMNGPAFVDNTSRIARCANRCVQVAAHEATSNEDPKFVERVNDAVTMLKSTIPPMLMDSKAVATNPGEQMAVGRWKNSNQALITAVGKVHHAVVVYPPGYSSQHDGYQGHGGYQSHGNVPNAPDISGLNISDLPDFDEIARQMEPPVEDSGMQRSQSQKASPQQSSQLHASPSGYGSMGRGGPEYSDFRYTPGDSHGVATSPGPYDPSGYASDGSLQRQKAQGSYGAPGVRIPVQHVSPATSPSPRGHGHLDSSFSPSGASSSSNDPLMAEHLESSLYGGNQNYQYGRESGPPRPPLPREDAAPPRPPPPETDDEDDFTMPVPQSNQPIMMAAHALHMEAKQWSSKDNDLIAAAKKMARLMARLSELVRGEGGVNNKKELILTAKAIAEASVEVTRLAKEVGVECTDRRMRLALLQVCERIPTIGTQLNILSTVKATMLGAQEPIPTPDGSEINCGSEEDQEATDMLVGNAQNLMQSVRETVRAAEAASIRIRVDSGYTIRWIRKRPWYT